MNSEGFFGAWSAYCEHLFLYILGAAAPNPEFATGAASYYAMQTFKSRYKGDEFIMCGSGAAFTYQWTHGFIDFRHIQDKHGRNWFNNSRHAAIAARQYAIDNAQRLKGLGPNSWGMSACMSPRALDHDVSLMALALALGTQLPNAKESRAGRVGGSCDSFHFFLRS